MKPSETSSGKTILFSDEAKFKSNSVVNRHNMHYWDLENPHCVFGLLIFGAQ
jgi:hypothetical protein